LNIDTVIIVKDLADIETARQVGDFDILRRGVVLPTADETIGMMAIFAPLAPPKSEFPTIFENKSPTSEKPEDSSNAESKKDNEQTPENSSKEQPETNAVAEIFDGEPILTEEDAIAEIPAIPLYFPTSYSLVKPYIQGFEINTLDAPSLKEVKIDNNWQPKKPNGES
jgi:hypothetical protein